MAAMVDATGHDFWPGGEPAEADIAPIREQLPVVGPVEASVLGNRELFGRLATTAMLPFMTQAVDRWRPDLVLRDPCEYASAIVAASAEIPVVQVAISLADAEWGSIDAAAPALEEHRPGLASEVRATPYLTRFPVALDPSPFPTTVRTRETAGRAPRPLPPWWGDDHRRLVYVTFGTVLGHLTSASSSFDLVVGALAELDARVLVTVGPALDPNELAVVPDHVHVESWVDQVDVLSQTDALVCHGGSGTVLGALGAGVPMVVVPSFADQFLNAEAVVASGAGVAVNTGFDESGHRRPLGMGDAPRIRAGLEEVLADEAYGRSARHLAALMAAAPTPGEVLESLTGGPLRPSDDEGSVST